ncbi:MAG: 6-hydroxymethylpterin diphosphokinase MptE-like protein [Halobacteria archaeon]
MRFEDWEPFYEAILTDFGYSREEDRRSARALNGFLQPFDVSRLDAVFGGADVSVVGNAPCLEPRDVRGDVVVAADAAARRLADAGVPVDVIVTDLDGAPRHAATESVDGTLVVVHAHGDNPDAVERWLPEFEARNVVGTTQTRPFGVLHNFGGFTDGDRAVFLADSFGASRIRLYGFDFTDARDEKREKLRWAHRLLRVLGEERDEKLV